jgi:hypothetical protein
VIIPERDALQLTLQSGCYLVGSPTTLPYRADLVRARPQFFKPGIYHEDTDTAYELMLAYDFGFVHQVLSFVRSDNESHSSAFPWQLGREAPSLPTQTRS